MMNELIFFNLSEKKEWLPNYVALVEKEFGYVDGEKFHFEKDFYPLLDLDNLKNAFGFYRKSNSEIVATIACYERKIWISEIKKSLNVLIMGAMTVKETEQGKGIFRSLMELVLKEKSEFDLYLLWSEKEELFAKFGFRRMFEQSVIPKREEIVTAVKVKNQNLVIEEKFAIEWEKEVWGLVRSAFQKRYEKVVGFDRALYWEKIEKMSSMRVGVIKESKKIVGYYFCGKGKDLPGIVHEWGFVEESYENEILNMINQKYIIWDYPFLCYKKFSNTTQTFAVLGMIKNKEILKILPSNMFIGGVDSL